MRLYSFFNLWFLHKYPSSYLFEAVLEWTDSCVVSTCFFMSPPFVRPSASGVSNSRLTHISLASHKRTLAISVDLDQTPKHAASDPGLHCLHYVQIFLQNKTIIKTNQTPLILEMNKSKELK